jgi:manganese transport protein
MRFVSHQREVHSRRAPGHVTVASLADLIRTPSRAQIGRALAIAGPAFAVSVGYVDPGNWATDLAAGRYGYALLWVVVLASLMAIVVQAVVVRLTFATGESLATTFAHTWPRLRRTSFIVYQAAAIATDLGEFAGVVVGLRLLFGMSTPAASLLGFAAVTLLLFVGQRGLRTIEVTLMSAVAIIALGYVYELHMLGLHVPAVLRGALVPTIPAPGAVAILVGIVGATVMPHNLFLHSAFIVERLERPAWKTPAVGARLFVRETVVALALALLVNAAILIVGAALGGSQSIEQAYRTIAPLAGTAAAFVFGGTLLCSGLAASTTATIAGDVVARDLAPIAIPRWLRRLGTLAPAVVLMVAGADATTLLIWSQVALALVLPAVLVPTIAVCLRRRLTAALPLPRWLIGTAIATAALCVAFDAALLAQPLL